MCYQDIFNKRNTTTEHFIYLYRTCVCKLTGYFSEALLSIAHVFVALSYIYFSSKLAYFNWSKTCFQKITTYSVKVHIDNSKALCPITFFCPCNAIHHRPSKSLHLESSNNLSISFAQTLPSNQLEVAQRGPNCDAFTYKEKQWMETCIQEGPLNSHTYWQWEQERNPKSSEFSVSTEHRLTAWHQAVQKPVLHHASVSAALQEPCVRVAVLPELARTQSYKGYEVILMLSQVKKKWKKKKVKSCASLQ